MRGKEPFLDMTLRGSFSAVTTWAWGLVTGVLRNHVRGSIDSSITCQFQRMHVVKFCLNDSNEPPPPLRLSHSIALGEYDAFYGMRSSKY